MIKNNKRRFSFFIRALFLFVAISSSLIALISPISLAFEINPKIETSQFKLLQSPESFKLVFQLSGKQHMIAIPRDWLIPPKEIAEDYVSSLNYGSAVNSFPIGNNEIGLHISSYGIQKQGSAGVAKGRDVFLIYNPKQSSLRNGGILHGITKGRSRYAGCVSGEFSNFLLADINKDGLSDISVIQERVYCKFKEDEMKGHYYKKSPIQWHLFNGNVWKKNSAWDGKEPNNPSKFPLIGMKFSPIDYIEKRFRGRLCFPGRQSQRAIHVPLKRCK